MIGQEPLRQVGGLLFFIALVAVLHGGHRLYQRLRTAAVHRVAARPVPGRLRPVDAAYLEQTREWLASLRPPPGSGLPRTGTPGERCLDGRAS